MRHDGSSDLDLRIADIVLRKGMCSREQIEECLKKLSSHAADPRSPIPSLGQLLADSGYLTPAQVNEAMQLSGPSAPRAESEAEALPAGRPMGKYIKVEKLGAGGMGEVWKGYDRDLRRWVALKFLKSGDEQELARFRREAQTAAKLNHPGIGAVFEVGEHDGQPFIAMQFVEGTTLSDVPRDNPRRMAEVIRDAARAVHRAHEDHVVHRDLKPDNLMVDSRGRVFVMDFGLAKQTRVDASLSMTGTILGTAAYMPPEQARGHLHDVDARSDVYSLGATLYELLADRLPHRGADVYEILKKVIEEEPRPLRRINPAIDRDLETIVHKCLTKEKEHRYADASMLADDLDRYLEGGAIQAHPPSVLYRVRKFVGRRKAVLGIGVAALLAVSILSIVLVPAWLEAEARRQELELFAPIERDLDLLRMRFYQPRFALTEPEFLKYEQLENRLRTRMKETGRHAHGWYLIGRCRETVADYPGADKAYAESIDINDRHAPSWLARGRLAAQVAFHEKFRKQLSREDADRIRIDSDRALDWVRHGTALAGAQDRMDTDLVTGYLKLLSGKTVGAYCDRMLEKWKGENFVEDFLILKGLTPEVGAQRHALFSRAIEHRPSGYEAYFWRAVLDPFQDDSRALRDLDTAIHINPRYIDARFHRGFKREKAGDVSGAEADYTRIIELRPEFIKGWQRRAEFRRRIGNTDGALQDCMAALRLDPEDPFGLANAASIHQNQGDLRKAEVFLDRMIRSHPDDFRGYVNRSGLRIEQKDWDGALLDIDKALQIDPKNAAAVFNRASVWLKQGRIDRGLEDLTESLRLDPENVETWIKRGDTRRNHGDPRGAREDYDRVLEREPERHAVWLNRGIVRAALGDRTGAIEDYTESIRLKPDKVKAFISRASARIDLKQYREAIADCDAAIRIGPDLAAAHANRSVALGRLGDRKGSRASLDEAIRLEPENPVFLYNRAFGRADDGDLSGALGDLDLVVRLKPGWARAYFVRGNFRLRAQDFGGAEKDYTTAIRLKHRGIKAYFNRGLVRYMLGKHDAAIVDLGVALKSEPRLDTAWSTRARCWLAKSEVERAWKDIQQAVRIHSENPETLITLGDVLLARGDRSRCIECYERALRIAPPGWVNRKKAESDLRRIRGNP